MDVLFVNNQDLEGFTNYTDNGQEKFVKPGSCPMVLQKIKKVVDRFVLIVTIAMMNQNQDI